MFPEKFCVRWNDFESNICSAFKDIRDEKEFFNVTIACDDEQLMAHKVILSACSPFFKSVLSRNQHPHPLLYLKGVSYRDMEAVLNFMYYGKVDVSQDDLNSFLQVAKDLQVKGLTQYNPGAATNTAVQTPDPSNLICPQPTHYEATPPAKSPCSNLPTSTSRLSSQPIADDDDIEVIVPVVKSEPTIMSVKSMAQLVEKKQTPMKYDGRSQVQASMVEQYHDNYGREYESQYGYQGYENMVGLRGQHAGGAGYNDSISVKSRLPRSHYTAVQIMQLEKEFKITQYLRMPERYDVAVRLGLSEAQVKIWFQNRRMKDKKAKLPKNRDTRQNDSAESDNNEFDDTNVDEESRSLVSESQEMKIEFS